MTAIIIATIFSECGNFHPLLVHGRANNAEGFSDRKRAWKKIYDRVGKGVRGNVVVARDSAEDSVTNAAAGPKGREALVL